MSTVVTLLFACLCSVVLHEAAPQTLAVSIDVDYTPPADAELGPNEYRAASSIVLTCTVEGASAPVNYSWDSTLAAGDGPNQRTSNALGSDDTGTHSCNVTEDNINFEIASTVINVVGAGIYVEVGDDSVPLGALSNNGLMIALDLMAPVRLQFLCRSTSNSSGVGQLVGPVAPLDQFFNISTLQVGTVEVINDGSLPSLMTMDQGIYTCRIPNSVGAMVDINVGIYPNGFDTQPTVTVARSNSNSTFSISCNSVGSPPTTIVWTKDENELTVDGSTIEALQSITDRGLSRYRNVLNINNQQPDDLVGAYTCVVTNALGSVGATLVLRGIQITGHEEPLDAGVSANLTCTSDFDVNLIEWLDGEGTVISSTNAAITLGLSFDPVTGDQQGQQYTCRVTSPYGVQQRSVNLTVIGATFNFQQLTYTTNEDAGILSLCIAFSGEIPPTETATITVTTQDSSATGGTDFQMVSQDLVFDSMSSPSDCIATVNLTILQDSTIEGTELFLVVLSSSDEFVVLEDSFTTSVVIQDDDVLTVSFTEANYTASEGAGSVMVCITSSGDLALEVSATVNIASQSVTAQASADYSEVSIDIAIEIESTGIPICMNIAIIDDNVVERQEMFQLNLSTSSDLVIFAEPRVANVTILDNDNLTIGFQSAVYSFEEDEVSTAQVVIEVSAGILGPGIPAMVSVTAEDGTAIRGQDYTFSPMTVNFQDNVLPITFVIIADIASEGTESFTFLLSTTEEYVIVTSANATVLIFDNIVLAEVPLSTTVLVGSTAEFRCSSNTPVNSLQWRVDGLFINNQEIIDRGFTEEAQNLDGIISTTLFALGSVSNNGSSIECVVLEIGNLQTLSDVASLTVQALRVGYEVTTYTTSEEEGLLTACIQIQNSEFLNEATVTITVPAVNGSAFAGEDYDPTYQRDLIVTESTGSQICVNITIIDDDLIEGVEEFHLTLSSFDQAVTFPAFESFTFVDILDNDFLTVSFEEEAYVVNENGGSEMFCFLITGELAPGVNATVNITAQPISAQAEVDYSPDPQSLSFTINCAPIMDTSGGDTLCVEVNIIDDGLVEGPETFRLILNTDELSVPEVDSTTVTINDNDVLTVGFTETSYAVNEDAGTVQFCFVASENLAPGLAATVNVTAQELSSPSAQADFDYLQVSTSTIVIDAESTGSQICVDIVIFDDDVTEGTERFSLFLGSGDEFVVLDPGSADVVINDNDDLTVGFTETSYAVNESSGLELFCFTVVGNFGPEITIVVNVTIQPFTAEAGTDYSSSSEPFTVAFNGETAGSPRCAEVTIIDDVLVEGPESFQISLSTDDDFTVVDPGMAIVTINDNDLLSVGFTEKTYAVDENSGSATFCFEATGNLGSGVDTVVNVTTQDITAQAQVDYSPEQDLIMFTIDSAGTGSPICVLFNIIDDNSVELNETFQIILSTDDNITVLNPDTALVTIVDDDELIVGFQMATYAFDEDAGTSSQIAVAVNSGSIGAGITATISVTAEDGTATSEEDYNTGEPITELVFSAGDVVQSMFFIIIDDAISEGTETFTFLLNTTEEFVSLFPATATVTISDNSALVEVPLSTTIVGGSTAQFQCSSATSVLSLMWIIDGLNITNGLIIERGFTAQLQNSDGRMTTTLFAEGFVTNNGSMIQCAVLNNDMLQSFSDIASLTVQVVCVGFEFDSYNATEEEGSVTGCILIENNQILGSREVVTVIVSSTDGSADGEDYPSALIAELDITRSTPGRICVNVTIFDDELVEDQEFFTIALGSSDEAIFFTTQFAVVTIESNDVATVGVTELSSPLSESDLQATVGIAVTQGVLQSGLLARVLVSTVNGTAQAEMDYMPFSEVINISQNSVTRVTLNPIDDDLVEGNQMYQITLASLSDFAVVESSATTVTISDNDFLTLGFTSDSTASNTIDENKEEVDVCLEIFDGTIEDMVTVALTVEVQGGLATLGEDFLLPSEPLMFGSGPEQDRDCFTVVIIDDSLEEGVEEISLELSNSDGFLVTPLTISIVILDDEAINCGAMLCLNDATCDVDGEFATCICAPGFTGDNCGIVIVPPPVLTISSFPPSVVPMAGDEYLLSCNVTVFEGLLAPIEISWADPTGTIVNNQTRNLNLQIIREERSAVAILVFVGLLTSQAGSYTCNAQVLPLSSDLTIGLSENFHLVVRIPIPSLSLFVDTDCIFAGATRFALSCTIELDENADDPIAAQIEWLPESIFSNSRITVESVSQLSDTTVYLSRLVFDPLLLADSLNYTCSGFFLPGNEASTGVSVSTYVDASDVADDTILLIVEAPPIQVEISPAESIRIPNVPPYNQYTVTCNASLPSDIRLRWSFTWIDDNTGDQFTVNDSVSITSTVDSGSTAFSVLQVTEERTGTFLPTCLAEVFSMDDEEGEIISSEFSSSLTVSVTGPNLPVQPVPAVVGTSFELAIISWTSSMVAYTPDVFNVEYTEVGTGSTVVPITQISETVMGTQDFSATDVVYSIILDGLKSDTAYTFQVIATNTEGSAVSQSMTFRTRDTDAYTLEESSYEVPIGSDLRIDVIFTQFSFDDTVQYMFIPLDHTPLQLPTFILSDSSVVGVRYAIVSPSLAGEYVLCRLDLCGSRITIIVTIPSLSISTNLLVTQRPNNGEVQCLPSDPRAPVRWVNTMGIIPSDITVVFSPPTLNHIAIFDGDSPPDRTEVFVCDLINVDEPDQPIDPQTVTVRFITNPVAILNNDRELNPGAVINSYIPSIQPNLNLGCLSINGHGDLQWRTREVEALPDVVDLETARQISFVNVSYLDDSFRREIFISYDPFDEQGTGYYACRSEESGYQAEVYTSLDNPIWELLTPRVYNVPLGAEVSILVRYADSSLGYINNGEGFSYELGFVHLTSPTPEGATVLSGVTNASSNILSYVFPAEFSTQGMFELSANHITSGVPYSEMINVTVFVPNVVDFDPVLFVLYGQNATVRCIPDDLRAPVLWVYSGAEEIFFQSFPSLFILSPPGLNHTATFDPTAVAMMFSESLVPTAVSRLFFRCGFRIDGLDITSGSFPENVPFNPAFSELYIQPERIRMQYSGNTDLVGVQIFNNTVVNIVPPPLSKREVGGPGPSDSPNDGLIGRFTVDCNAVQGYELPIWTTDNNVTGNASGIVINDGQQPFGSVIISEYTATLFFAFVVPFLSGNYRCQSRSSDLFSQFFLTPENPYIARISPAVVVVNEGDPARLEFQIAVDSNGNTWDSDNILFFFSNDIDNDRNGNQVSFVVDSALFPQNYVRNFESVTRADAGVYTAQVLDFSSESATSVVEESLILDVILFCPSNAEASILWPRTQQNTLATAPCSQAGSFFREGTQATRRCMENGEWEDVDFTSCTLVESSPPFLLLSLVIEADEVEGELESFLVMEVSRLLDDRNVPYADVTLQSAFIASVALSFQVALNSSVSPQDQEAFLGPISDFIDFFNNDLIALGENFILTPLGSRGIVGVIPSDSCPCTSGLDSSATFLPLCEGTSRSPCACTDDQCQCQDPFVGDGLSCTLDSDGDGYPDSPLQSCTPENTEIFCIQDVCPTVNNPNQDLLDCQPDAVITEPEFNGCPYGPDPVWNITWANTERGDTDVQRCPGGVDTLGLATRFCDQNGNWSNAVVLECASVQFVRIESQAEVVVTSFSEGTIDARQFATAAAAITLELTVATEPEAISLLPSDLNSTNNVLSGLLSVIEAEVDDPDAAPDTSLVEIFDNVLEDTNTQGWLELQTVDSGSQVLLDSAERYGLYLARASNDTTSEMILSRPNIVISGRMVDSESLSVLNDSIVFPQEQHLVNHSSDVSSAQIIIPVDLIRERLDSEADTVESIPVANILFQSLERFLPPSISGLNNSQGASPVITSQVGSERGTQLSPVLLLTPVRLMFTFEMIEEALEFQCAFWNFSDPVGNGSFASTGVQLTRNTSDGSTTTVLCESTHLTSFAVLVDVRGTLQGISEAERLALQVVSYIGCAISVICLIITIVYFLLEGKRLFNAVHYFVHLNLAISLCLGYLIFLIGIETATSSAGGCAFVAALLHYFFLSAFCWMLCEGIMLYLMLVVVFSRLTKKWWFFLLIGYCLPLPAVVIGLAARHDYYGVRVDGNLEFCWLSAEKGTIWAFVAPVIVIVIVNVVFLCLVLRSLWKSKKGQKSHQMKEGSDNILKLVKTTVKSVIILLPLLGLTWLFGILTLNANSTVFAWFFLIFNSTQGVFILFFHVIRSDKVWNKIGPTLSQIGSTRFKKYRISRISDTQSASTSSTFLKGTFQRKRATDSGAVELGTLRSNTSVTDNTDTIASDTCPIPEHKEPSGLEVIENTGVVDPLPEKVTL